MNEEIQETSLIFAKYGPLITQAQAARILKKTKTRIKQMINEGKLQSVECQGVKMIPFSNLLK